LVVTVEYVNVAEKEVSVLSEQLSWDGAVSQEEA
jgi:hypothetical protein